MSVHPITSQPPGQPGTSGLSGQPMMAAAEDDECPLGLENLRGVNELRVERIIWPIERETNADANASEDVKMKNPHYVIKDNKGERIYVVKEASEDVKMKNHYVIKDNDGKLILVAKEVPDSCSGSCCGPARGFTMDIMDEKERDLIRLVRPFICCGGCGWFADYRPCSYVINVEAPVGKIIGYVKQRKYFLGPRLVILNHKSEYVQEVNGPFCMCQDVLSHADIDFTILKRKKEIGKITKKWTNCFKHAFVDAPDVFIVSFPVEYDVKEKVTLLAALFLIDFMFFEELVTPVSSYVER